jgi:Holliday junction resolvase
LAVPGLPDLLGYNKHQHFFTVELKVTRSNKIRFSPHQIAFHVQHPKSTYILVKSLDTSLWKLYEGKDIRELAACGLKLEACRSGLVACCLQLEACRS